MTQTVVFLNSLTNAAAGVLLAPIAVLPGWLSATLVAVVTGVLMLLMFKYTSNQRAVKQTRDRIKSNLLATSLFKDNMGVSFRCQGRVFVGALRLLLLAIVPMLVMIVPMCLLLAQLALWYETKPLEIGEEAVLSVFLPDDGEAESTANGEAVLPDVRFQPPPDIVTTIGPVRVPSKRMVCWNIRAEKPGYHDLAVEVNGKSVNKELAVGQEFMQVSLRRPAWAWTEALLYPREAPFSPGSVVESIEITYLDHERSGWTTGSGYWVVYWFVASMVAAFAAKPFLNVNI